MRGDPVPHMLLVGPIGLGKATLAAIIAKSRGVHLLATSGSAIAKAGDLAGVLTKLEDCDVLFIDEVQRLRSAVEYLVPAMTTFHLDLVVDQGANSRSVRLNLPRFTVVGSTATTKQVSGSLLPAFPVVERLEYYGTEDLVTVLRRTVDRLGIDVDTLAIQEIAEHAGGTIRGACDLLRHVRDFAQVKRPSQRITAEIVHDAFKVLELGTKNAEIGFERDPIPRDVRIEVWRRDGGKCVRCGGRERLEFDHIVPVSKGGSNTARNIELLCETCNRSKGCSVE